MKCRMWFTVLLLLLLCCASTAFAEQVAEVWRYPWAGVGGIAASAYDGSVWVTSTDSGSVLRFAPGLSGLQEVVRVSGLPGVGVIAANSADGSCWVSDSVLCQVVHLAANGDVLSRTGGIGGAAGLSVDPTDGSCWVADRSGGCAVVHLNSDGTVASRTPYQGLNGLIAAVPGTDSCWFVECQSGDDVRHLQENPDGPAAVVATASALGNIDGIAVDSSDGTLWVANCNDPGAVLHLQENPDHTIAPPLSTTPLQAPKQLSAVPGAGVWVVERCGGGSSSQPHVVHLDAAGIADVTLSEINVPSAVSADVSDGSCWVLGSGELVHVAATGETLQEKLLLYGPTAVAANPLDGSSWVVDPAGKQVLHITAAGDVVASAAAFSRPASVAVDPLDGTVWVGDMPSHGLPTNEVVHLAADGSELSRTGGFCCPQSLAVDPSDHACWVADGGSAHPSLTHLAPGDGAATFSAVFTSPSAVVVDPSDSSIWLGARDNAVPAALRAPALPPGIPTLFHLAWAGGALSPISSVEVPYPPGSLAVDPFDSSCLAVMGGVIRAASAAQSGDPAPRDGAFAIPIYRVTDTPAGPTLAMLGRFLSPRSVSVSPRDRSIWVGDEYQVAHLSAEGALLSRSGEYSGAGSVSVDAATGSCWVASSGFGPLVAVSGLGSRPIAVFSEGGGTVARLAVAPDAEFTASTTRGASPLTVQFTDLSAGGADSWLWDFGDGTSSTEEDPAQTYEDPGFYTVTLQVGHDGAAATMTKPAYIAVGFGDTPGDHWALMEEIACAEAGIIQGYWNGDYRPGEAVNRAQMAVYIARALAGGDEHVPSGPAMPTFTDVAVDHWAYRHIEYCAGLEIVTGYGGGAYLPDQVVNRGQMAVFIARTVTVPTGMEDFVPGTISLFTDVTSANDWAWCYKYIQYVAALDPPIVVGYADGTYHPERQVTRDQMAVYMQRAFHLWIPGATE